MSDAKSSQGSRVALELEALRQKQLAKNQRNRLKDLCAPLTTPEEAQAFLAAMRDKSNQREFTHKPPSTVSSDGMDAWYAQQKSKEKELRLRKKEAEQLLRGYRASVDMTMVSQSSRRHSASDSFSRWSVSTPSASELHFEGSERTNFEGDEGGDESNAQLEEEILLRNKQWAMFDEKKLQEKDYVSHHADLSTESPVTVPHDPDKLPSDDDFADETIWRDFISNHVGSKFPPESGRYRLYLSYACPGSHRALIVRTLKGLEDVVPVTFVHPTWRLTNPLDPIDKHRGWVFGNPSGAPFPNTVGRGGPFPAAYKDTLPDPEFDAYSIRELYEHANDNSGKYTIPLLWDTKLKTIVNNESSDIAYILNSCFNDFAEFPDVDLYTEYDEDGIAKLNEVSEWLSPLMIHGVYRCGFAKNQASYNKAITELCIAFDRADDILQTQRYLTGDTLTDADIRLFVTLLRFDEVYAFYFKVNARLVMLTPNLLNFCRDIYQIPGVSETVDMDQIKAHFFGSHAEWNKYAVIPRGLGFMELLEMPHNRDRLSTDEDDD